MNSVSNSAAALPRGFPVTLLIIMINVLIYIALEFNGGPTYENLLRFGAKENGLIAEGQIGRLFFPMFLHAGLLHLFFNMYGLFFVGRYLELRCGWRTLVVVYVVSGITANLCSFALGTGLSVGASGSLFGILLCLYMIERFERKLAHEISLPVRTTQLGPMIILNGIISFVIPNIDWANHLGGAIAGALIGQGIAMQQEHLFRTLKAARFLDPRSSVIKAPFWKRGSMSYLLIFILNLGFASHVKRITFAERAFGRGILLISEKSNEKRTLESLPQFDQTITSPRSETAFARLFSHALTLHHSHFYASARKTYEVILLIDKELSEKTPYIDSNEKKVFIERALDLSANAHPLDEELIHTFKIHVPETESTDLAAGCSTPGKLMHALGFYQLSARLFECAYFSQTDSIDLAAHAIGNYWLNEEHRKALRFVQVIELLKENKVTQETLPGLGEAI